MASTTRIERVGDLLQRTLAELIMREVKDPRVKMVSISAVEVSRDLAHAKVFISVIGDEEKAKAALKGLENAKGFLRVKVAQRCELRIVPELHFEHDKSVLHGRYMSDLIDKAREKDRSNSDEDSK